MTCCPPFDLTDNILSLGEEILLELKYLETTSMVSPSVTLRRSNRIKTIHASLAIEGNALTEDQITDMMDGKRVLGHSKDIIEVKNAIAVYKNLQAFNPLNLDDLLQAHQILMQNLVPEYGRFRSGGVGIFQGDQVVHVAPQADRVPYLMQDLFDFVNNADSLSWLLKSCIFHYEFEFIHPFVDGNGRMGRLWQQLLLMKDHPVFAFIPVEDMVLKNQSRYYEALGQSNQEGKSTAFIEFAMQMILSALMAYTQTTNPISI